MLFSAWPSTTNPWSELLSLIQYIEETGWDGIWLSDHFMPDEGDNTGEYNEAWTTLAALAATVPRVRLGVLVSGNTYRHPAVLAKMAATVDIISGGRLVLGLGAAWQKNEHVAFGIPFYTVSERLRRLEEACQVIRSLFDNVNTTFQGRYYQLKDAPLSPREIRRSRPPLMVGGGGESVTLRIAARYADEWNVKGTPEEFTHKAKVLDRHCADIGRDPSEIKRSVYATLLLSDDPSALERVDYTKIRPPLIAGNATELKRVICQYIEAGADEFVFTPINLGDAKLEKEQYDLFMQEVIPAFR